MLAFPSDFWPDCILKSRWVISCSSSNMSWFPIFLHLLTPFPSPAIPITSRPVLPTFKAILNLSCSGYFWSSQPLVSHHNTSLTYYILLWIGAVLSLSQLRCQSVGYSGLTFWVSSEQSTSIEPPVQKIFVELIWTVWIPNQILIRPHFLWGSRGQWEETCTSEWGI